MFNIQFNNYNSYMDLGLIVEHKPNIPTACKNTNEIYIEGRNGALTEDLGTYKDINITIDFGFAEKTFYNDKIKLIKHWLNNITDNKLIFSTDNSMFYKVKNIVVSEFVRKIKSIGRLTVNFSCEPFSYFLDGLNITELNTHNTLYAPEFAVKSYPFIKVYGNGNGTLTINNKSIELKNIQDYVVIDSKIQECYRNDKNCNNKMCGEFPILIEENKISWTGGINKIEIIPNWCCL